MMHKEQAAAAEHLLDFSAVYKIMENCLLCRDGKLNAEISQSCQKANLCNPQVPITHSSFKGYTYLYHSCLVECMARSAMNHTIVWRQRWPIVFAWCMHSCKVIANHSAAGWSMTQFNETKVLKRGLTSVYYALENSDVSFLGNHQILGTAMASIWIQK